MATKRTLIKIILPLAILLAGIVMMRGLIMNRQAPQKVKQVNQGALVKFIEVKKAAQQVEVTGTGVIQASEEVSIAPQVSGIVTSIAPHFVAGGFFKAGELLFSLNDTDYLLAVEQAKANLAKARSNVLLTEGKADIARQEWTRINTDDTRIPNPLTVHEPQLQEARANLAAAEASLSQARLNVSRTRLTAPFDCLIRSEHIGPGQFVMTGIGLAVLTATDTVEVIVPLPLEELQWLDIPAQSSRGNGSRATVILHLGDQTHRWKGSIARSLGVADPQDRMTRLAILVKDPYASLSPSATDIPDLMPGSYVDVIIHGAAIPDITVLPITALRDDSTVWLMDSENKLLIRPVTIRRMQENSFWVSEGLENGDKVIVTALSGGADGMLLRPFQQEKKQ